MRRPALGNCWFDGSDHEGELRPYLVDPRRYSQLLATPRPIPPTRNKGLQAPGPGQPAMTPLCERRARVLEARLA